MAVKKPVVDRAMTGSELKQLRTVLGDAIGRRLSLVDTAKVCGLSPDNAADTIRSGRTALGPPRGRWRPCFLLSPQPTATADWQSGVSRILSRTADDLEQHVRKVDGTRG